MKRSNVFNLTLTAVFLAMNIALSSFGVLVPDFTGCRRCGPRRRPLLGSRRREACEKDRIVLCPACRENDGKRRAGAG